MANDAILWSEHYRPKSVDECILPVETKKLVKESIASGNISNYLFYGVGGIGKTSLAKAIANDLGADLYYINASMDTSIDNIRSSVVSFSSTVSFEDAPKIVLLDEADGLSQAAQNSLKGVVEQFPTTRFIMTTNNLGKMIDPLKSRSVVVDFKIPESEKQSLSVAMMKRIVSILKEREVAFEPKVIAELVNKYFPDFRRTLNELQRYANSGAIDSGILLNQTKVTYDALIAALKDKDFKAMRLWVGENGNNDPANLFSELYANAFEYFAPQSVPTLVLLLADFQFKATHAVDQQINTAAALTEIMINLEFK